MLELQTTTLSTYRGTTVNAYGDKTDVGSPYLTGVPAALVETAKNVFDRATQRPQTVRTIECRVPTWADIIDTDTLKDEQTGDYFMVEGVQRQPTLGLPVDFIMLTLRARSGVAIATD